MRRLLWAAILGAVSLTAGTSVWGQTYGGAVTPYGTGTYYASPGYYGTGYGVPALGLPRTYSAFSSPYGMGYGYGYAPYSNLPGAFGIGLWRPGFQAPGYVYGASYYGTFGVPYMSALGFGYGATPGMGWYAPGFGPTSFYGW